MKIKQQSGDAMNHLADKLKEHRVAMLTLDEPPNGLSSRPMTPMEMDEQGTLWFMSSRAKMQPLLDGGGCAANVAFAREDISDYVSLAGELGIVDDAQRKQDLWSAMARVWFSGPDDPDLCLLKFTPRHAEIWDGPDSRTVRVLAMAASVVAGHEVGLGSKEGFSVPPRP